MSDRRQKASGCGYRKRAKESLERKNAVIQKTRKLDAFLIKSNEKKSGSNNESTSSHSNGCTVPEVSTVSSNAGGNISPTMLIAQQQPEQSEKLLELPEQRKLAEQEALPEEQDLPEQEKIPEQQFALSKDPAEWVINDRLRDYLSIHGIEQNAGVDFSGSKRLYDDQTRYLSKSLFERHLLNGEKSTRNWLIYSESTGRVYCGPCLAFDGGSQFGCKEGFNDWKNGSSRVACHENSSGHKLCVLNLKKRGNICGRIDRKLTVQLEEGVLYWRNVLKRVAATVIALASRGLPFRGHDEKFGSQRNGNYLMSLELIAEFDPFLAEHISRYGNRGSGHTSYLSSTICDEFIQMMAHKVKSTIVGEIKSAKYFSIIVDSTPDISHVDQLTFVVRYVQEDGSPIERFLEFFPNAGHSAQKMAGAVTATLDKFGIDIANCRGQSYDNAANMSGVYNGLQAQIKKLSSKAEYVPCAAHSLNLIGESAAESCEEACRFFALSQEVYNFFTSSTQRWEILQNEIQLTRDLEGDKRGPATIKSLSATRWSARADACRSLYESWENILRALRFIEDNKQLKAIVRCEAKGIRLKLERLETAFMTIFWGFILNRINATNKKLQSVDIDIFTAVQLYESLINLLTNTREDFDYFEERAFSLSVLQEYEKDMRRQKKRKIQSDDSASEEVRLNGREDLRINTFLMIIDNLLSEFRKRRDAYEKFHDKFAFLTNLSVSSPADTRVKAVSLQNMYPSDLEESFADECLHFGAHCSLIPEKSGTALKLLKWLHEEDLQSVYPNVDIALRMCACVPVTNCSGERSFSWLRRVKNYLRSKMTEDRLNALAVLSIESQLSKSLDYEDVIHEFATKKSRRAIF